MKFQLLMVCFIFAWPAAGQKAPDYLSMEVEEIRKLLMPSHDGVEADRFVELAFTSRRQDLLRLAFEVHITAPHFWERLMVLPDSKFRQEIVSNILRSEALTGWPDGPGGWTDTIQAGFALRMQKLMQNEIGEVIEYRRISNRTRRLELALEYEQAIARNAGARSPSSALEAV